MQSSLDLSYEAALALLQSIARFLSQHQSLWRAHVVEFFQERLWEHIDADWWKDLQHASIYDLLWLPSGKVQDTWCTSLKEFVQTAQSLALHRKSSGDLKRMFPGLFKPVVSNVLKQGMNFKKQHEVEILSAVVDQLAQSVHATHIVDVGAGQGYLAQVLAFEHHLPVVALDACAHHTDVTNERSKRIKKYYTALARKSNLDCTQITGPETATFHVVSGSGQMNLQHFLSSVASEKLLSSTDEGHMAFGEEPVPEVHGTISNSCANVQLSLSSAKNMGPCSFVLAGLHACGDLSATMLRTYMMCEEVKAVVTVGCCYNLLSEDDDENLASGTDLGFPLSKAAKGLGLTLGRRARDLACQSADRWKDIGPESAMQNFQQHALRAAFQLVLHRFYPDVAKLNPSIGRLGKARRRKQVRSAMVRASSHQSRELNLLMNHDNCCMHASKNASESGGESMCLMSGLAREAAMPKERDDCSTAIDLLCGSIISKCMLKEKPSDMCFQCNPKATERENIFIEFADAAFERLGLQSTAQKDLQHIWREIEPQTALIGPFWSLRAVLGPVLETYILLDRLLYLQEALFPYMTSLHSLRDLSEPRLVALFDPEISPRNMAIIAIKH